MGDGGWLVVIAFAGLVNPVVIAASVVSGPVIQRWWHVALGLLTAPAAYWIYGVAIGTIDIGLRLLPFLGVSGVIWTAAAFAFKKAAAT